jgi:membrane protein implicated in regulation of membrane protease activity
MSMSQAGDSVWATIVPGWIAAVGTGVLAIFAIVTALYAIRAFRKQSQEVSDQAEMLQVQSDRLEVYRGQVDEQREMNAKYREALDLQASEIRASLDQRERAGEEERRSQAAQVTAWFEQTPGKTWAGHIRNASDLPVFDVRTFFYYVAEKWQGGDWDPQMLGGPVEKIRVLPPQQDRFVAIPENVWGQMTDVSANSHVVSIEFTDAAGNHWERDPRGALIARS